MRRVTLQITPRSEGTAETAKRVFIGNTFPAVLAVSAVSSGRSSV